MKKTYITPDLGIVEIGAQTILNTGSTFNTEIPKMEEDDEAGAKAFDMFDDE